MRLWFDIAVIGGVEDTPVWSRCRKIVFPVRFAVSSCLRRCLACVCLCLRLHYSRRGGAQHKQIIFGDVDERGAGGVTMLTWGMSRSSRHWVLLFTRFTIDTFIALFRCSRIQLISHQRTKHYNTLSLFVTQHDIYITCVKENSSLISTLGPLQVLKKTNLNTLHVWREPNNQSFAVYIILHTFVDFLNKLWFFTFLTAMEVSRRSIKINCFEVARRANSLKSRWLSARRGAGAGRARRGHGTCLVRKPWPKLRMLCFEVRPNVTHDDIICFI